MKSRIGLVVLILMVVALTFSALRHITLSFVWMYGVLAILLLIPFFVKGTVRLVDNGRVVDDSQKGGNIKEFRTGFFYATIILLFGVFSTIVLKQYFNPKESVFKNNDHYALRIDGINISRPRNFILAGNSEDAFFDRLEYSGQLQVIDFDSTRVKIRSDHFSNPVFVLTNHNDSHFHCNKYEIVNAGLLPVFSDGDDVTLISRQGASLSFSVKSVSPKKLGDGPHAQYIVSNGADVDTTEYKTFLRRGYPLKSIFGNTSTGNIDLSGVTITRTVNYPAIKPRFEYKAYKDVPFALIVPEDSEIRQVIINGTTFKPTTGSFEIPTESLFFIGFSDNKSYPSKFHLHDNALSLEFDMPRYQFLSSISDAPESTVMFTSSIIGQDGNLINDISDNVLLFEMFSHPSNIYNFKPHYLSFRTGRSEQDLVFSMFSTMNNQRVDNLYSMDYNLRVNESDDKYSYYFPGITCNGDHSTWNITAENFKKTTPTQSSTIILIIFLVSLISALLISLSSSTTATFTKIEYVAYLLTIAFLSVRLFLMWRISVFPPIHNISKLEFDKYLDVSHSNLFTIIASLLFFYASIFLAKLKYLGIEEKVKKGKKTKGERGKKLGFFIIACGFLLSILLKVSTSMLDKVNVLVIIGIFGVWAELFVAYYYAASPVIIKKSKGFDYLDKGYKKWKDYYRTGKTWHFYLWPALAYVVACIGLSILKGNTTVNILLPLVLFILTEIYINWINPAKQDLAAIFNRMKPAEIEEYKNTDPELFKTYDNLIRHTLAFSIINTAIITMIMLVHDGGYGSMFLVFGVVYSSIQVSNYLRSCYYPDKKSRKKADIISYLVIIPAIVFIAFFKQLMVMMLDNPLPLAIIIGVAGFVILLGLAVLLRDWKIKKRCVLNTWTKRLIAVIVLGVCIVLFVIPKIGKNIDGSHTEFRIRVHKETAEEILANDVSDDDDERKFSQASLNDWIIHEYREYGKQVKPFGSKDKSSYFVLQPQSKVGAMWFAQTTDISLVRYIIAEHSELLAIFFILVFFIAFIISLLENTRSRWTKSIIVMIPLLLLIQSVMIWMANTQRFVFFGQDFPLISITSNFATLYFFVLMMFWVMAALVADQDIMTPIITKEGKKYTRDEENQRLVRKREVRVVYTPIALAVAFAIYFLIFHGQKQFDEYGHHIYDYENLMTKAAADLQIINDNFEEYQDQRETNNRPLTYRTNMKADIDDFFNQYPLTAAIPDSTSFTYRLLQKYIEKGSTHNSIQDVIHIHKEKRSDANDNVETTLVFDIRDSFYRLKLPSTKSREWTGDVYEYTGMSVNQHSFEVSDAAPQYITAWISGKYLGEGKDVFLIKARGNADLFIRGNNCPVSVSQRSVPAAIVHEEDNVYLESVRREPLEINKKNYFARNILLNGQRSFIYPMQSDFFWARTLAGDFKNAQNEPDAGDISITLSSSLMRSLSDVYESNPILRWDKSIVVADGNGKVKALVDYKYDGKYRLNPNDSRRIIEVSDSLYLEGESKRPESDRYFSNLSLLKLKKGPGSSQKPILWTVVTTGYKTDYWQSLGFAQLPDRFEPHPGGNYSLKWYAGVKLPKDGFYSIASDEGLGHGDIDLGFYMYKSSNYYNSLMAYIGSFDKLDLEDQRNPIFTEIQAPKNQREYDENKPYVKMYGTNTLYHFNRQLSEIDLSDPSRGIINLGLNDNFGYSVYGNENLSSIAFADASLYPSLQISNSSGRSYPIAVASPSLFRAEAREQATDSYTTEFAVRLTAIGSASIWDVTPLKMAEMYGKMVSLNKNYHLTIDPGISPDYEPFVLDEDWNGMGEYLRMRRPFISGMNQVFTNGGGTANSVFTKLNSRNMFTGVGQRYFIYGKTGTIDNRSTKKQDHLLAVVITNRDINTCTSQEELMLLKFYVIYISDYDYKINGRTQGGSWQGIAAGLIDAVVTSDDFRNYMNEN